MRAEFLEGAHVAHDYVVAFIFQFRLFLNLSGTNYNAIRSC
jgi:hypothetical protein